MRYIEATFHS